MNWLYFYLNVARLQVLHDGGVSPKMICDDSGMPRSSVNRYLSKLLNEGFIFKLSHGLYGVVSSDCSRAVGQVTLSPMDIHLLMLQKD